MNANDLLLIANEARAAAQNEALVANRIHELISSRRVDALRVCCNHLADRSVTIPMLERLLHKYSRPTSIPSLDANFRGFAAAIRAIIKLRYLEQSGYKPLFLQPKDYV
jgi:hypothetical protein